MTVTASAGDLSVPGEAREPLAQALLNLLLNAIAHSPPSGRVDLTAHSVGDDVAITVRDRGPGIPASDRDRIFEPFHTGTRDGTGLGLSVVRGLCREQGWQLGVEDAPGGGAVFRVGMRSSAGGASSAGAGGAGDASPRGRISDAPTQPATTD